MDLDKSDFRDVQKELTSNLTQEVWDNYNTERGKAVELKEDEVVEDRWDEAEF